MSSNSNAVALGPRTPDQTTCAQALSNEELLELYRKMLVIRAFEEEAVKLFMAGELPGFLHVYTWEEAVAVGVCSCLRKEDYITSTHRGHGHVIAKGADTKAMMAELFARSTGLCKGKGGSMHIADFSLGIIGANGIVSGGMPIAVGVALSCVMRGTDNVVACFFGDGASNNGNFHEALNLASVWSLPVVFVCENNGYAVSTRHDRHKKVPRVADRAAAYGMPGVTVDGMDVLEVRNATLQAVRAARCGQGPTLLECMTYRKFGHYVGDPAKYRPPEEVASWASRDPIAAFRSKLTSMGLSRATLEAVEAGARGEITSAVEYARACPATRLEEALTDVYAPTQAGRRVGL